jgi:hypothetical protein
MIRLRNKMMMTKTLRMMSVWQRTTTKCPLKNWCHCAEVSQLGETFPLGSLVHLEMMTLPLAKLSQLKAKLGVALFNKTLDAVENEKNVNAGQTAVIGKKSNSKVCISFKMRRI